MVNTEEKDYWNKEEIGERLKWLTVGICAMTIIRFYRKKKKKK
ncbi:MAG: hypothetical protein ACTSO6_03680 [Promethearchaeota archaeon]